MSLSAKAILARFNFNRARAIKYCESLARTYPNLTKEYLDYAATIRTAELVEVTEDTDG